MAYYHKLNDIKKSYQKRYEHCYAALKTWEKSIVPVYKKDGTELKSKKKAFPEISFNCSYGGNIDLNVYFLNGTYHDNDELTIYNKYCDINELSYNDILTAVNKRINGLKESCDNYFKVLNFIDTDGMNLFNDLKDVIESYDDKLPGYLKYFVYKLFERESSLEYYLTDDLLIKKGTFKKDFSDTALNAMIKTAGFREKTVLDNYDYYKEPANIFKGWWSKNLSKLANWYGNSWKRNYAWSYTPREFYFLNQRSYRNSINSARIAPDIPLNIWGFSQTTVKSKNPVSWFTTNIKPWESKSTAKFGKSKSIVWWGMTRWSLTHYKA